jgi:hypothetical protein
MIPKLDYDKYSRGISRSCKKYFKKNPDLSDEELQGLIEGYLTTLANEAWKAGKKATEENTIESLKKLLHYGENAEGDAPYQERDR